VNLFLALYLDLFEYIKYEYVSSIIMKLYIHFHIYIMHSKPPTDMYIHKDQFCDSNHGRIFTNKSSVLLGLLFSVRIWKAHKHFCKATICQLETVSTYRGTVIQLDKVWCSHLFLVAFINLHAYINTLQSMDLKLVT
jgi:hypothetical protein